VTVSAPAKNSPMKHHDATRPTVFLSYGARDRDRPWIKAFADALAKRDVAVWAVWSDLEQIRAGDRWEEALEKALRESDTIVVILSPESLSSESVQFDIGVALGTGKRLVPILLDPTSRGELPPYLRDRQIIEDAEPEEAARRVAGIFENGGGRASAAPN
jgi:hypothetical protein